MKKLFNIKIIFFLASIFLLQPAAFCPSQPGSNEPVEKENKTKTSFLKKIINPILSLGALAAGAVLISFGYHKNEIKKKEEAFTDLLTRDFPWTRGIIYLKKSTGKDYKIVVNGKKTNHSINETTIDKIFTEESIFVAIKLIYSAIMEVLGDGFIKTREGLLEKINSFICKSYSQPIECPLEQSFDKVLFGVFLIHQAKNNFSLSSDSSLKLRLDEVTKIPIVPELDGPLGGRELGERALGKLNSIRKELENRFKYFGDVNQEPYFAICQRGALFSDSGFPGINDKHYFIVKYSESDPFQVAEILVAEHPDLIK